MCGPEDGGSKVFLNRSSTSRRSEPQTAMPGEGAKHTLYKTHAMGVPTLAMYDAPLQNQPAMRREFPLPHTCPELQHRRRQPFQHSGATPAIGRFHTGCSCLPLQHLEPCSLRRLKQSSVGKPLPAALNRFNHYVAIQSVSERRRRTVLKQDEHLPSTWSRPAAPMGRGFAPQIQER
jgi:hypothetical protein